MLFFDGLLKEKTFMKVGTEVQPLNDFYASNLKRFNLDKSQVNAMLRQRSIKYGDFVLHAEMAPLIFSKEELATYQKAGELVWEASEIFTQAVLKNPAWLKDCVPDERLRELIKIDPGYKLNIPCSRFDTFPKKQGPIMIELNPDGCSGMSNIDTFHELYINLVGKAPGTGLENFTTEAILPHLFATITGCYKEFCENYASFNFPEKPTIAIIDWQTEDTFWEFHACADYFRRQGYRTLVLDPTELEWNGKWLLAAGEPVHLIYRRLLGEDWVEAGEKLSGLTEAYKAHKVCVVGSLRSQIVFNKKLFSYLRSEEVLKLFRKEVREAVLQTVPFTVPWKEKTPECEFKGKTIKPSSFVRANKDLFVLKPCRSKCGLGIVQGFHATEEEWQKALDQALEEEFIVQEFVPLETAYFPVHGKTREVEKRYLHAGIYVFGGKFSGFFGRTCKDPLLTLRHGERMMPVLKEV